MGANFSLEIYSLDFSSVCGILLLAAACAVIIRNFGFKGAPVFAALVVCIFFSKLSEGVFMLSETIGDFEKYSDVSTYVSDVTKLVGINYLGSVSADIVNEMDEGAIAKCINTLTKMEMLIVSLPYIEKILEVSVGLLGG